MMLAAEVLLAVSEDVEHGALVGQTVGGAG